MRKADVIKILKERIEKIDAEIIFKTDATREELIESSIRTDEIRNVACILGILEV